MANSLQETDSSIFELIQREKRRQHSTIQLIASENYTSKAVQEAQGSVLTNKYAEGYPGKRYYAGCEVIDEVENLAINRAKKLFGAAFANVQPHSGSQANQAVFLALLQPGDTVLSMSLSDGGHLTHGSKANLSGKWFNFIHYGVNPESHLLDYEIIASLAEEYKPKLIIAGYSAYSRQLDFAKFHEISRSVGAYLLVDMAHFAGLVAAGLYPNPLDYADVVTSTTHKTLRGPRGGIILAQDLTLGKKLDSAVFPGLQGGPLMHVIAAKAVAFGEALSDQYKKYIVRVIENARTIARVLQERGYKVLTGGTDSHMVLLDVFAKGLTGVAAETTLYRAGLICNKNTIPSDKFGPQVTSGLRLGSPAATSRGFDEVEFTTISHWIADLLDGLASCTIAPVMNTAIYGNELLEQAILNKVQSLCDLFPLC